MAAPDRGTDYALRFEPGVHVGAALATIRPGDAFYEPSGTYPHMQGAGTCRAVRRDGRVAWCVAFPLHGLHVCNVEKGVEKNYELAVDVVAPEIVNRCGETVLESFGVGSALPMRCTDVLERSVEAITPPLLSEFGELTGTRIEFLSCPALLRSEPPTHVHGHYLLARVGRHTGGEFPVCTPPGTYLVGLEFDWEEAYFESWCRARLGAAGVDASQLKEEELH